MNHANSNVPIKVVDIDGYLGVRLFDYEDFDHLDDRLTEDFDLDPSWYRFAPFEGKEAFELFFPNVKTPEIIQKAIDQIA